MNVNTMFGLSKLMSTARRLLKELHEFHSDPNPNLENLGPVADDDLFNWAATLKGPKDSPYEGGLFKLSVAIPQSYPIHSPTIKFITPICHPNIHFKTGEICLDILKNQWSPAWTISTAFTAIQALLTDPEPSSPLNVDAANLVRSGDMVAYNSLVRMYARLYAVNQ